MNSDLTSALQSNDPQVRAFLHYAKIGFMLTGLLMQGIGAYWLFDDYRTRNWLVTPAVVKSVQVKSAAKNRKKLQVTYEYQSADKVISNTSNASFRNTQGISSLKFETLIKMYAVGNPIFVYLNPKNPTKSRLRRGFHYSSFLFLIGGFYWSRFGRMFENAAQPAAAPDSPPANG